MIQFVRDKWSFVYRRRVQTENVIFPRFIFIADWSSKLWASWRSSLVAHFFTVGRRVGIRHNFSAFVGKVRKPLSLWSRFWRILTWSGDWWFTSASVPKQSTFARVRSHEEPIKGCVLSGSTVSGWLVFFVLYWGNAVFSWFGWPTFATGNTEVIETVEQAFVWLKRVSF